MLEFLSKYFGKGKDGQPEALTLEQLTAKMQADTELKLANLAEGGYVGKDKYDAKEAELKGVRDQLTAANAEIKSYKDMDIEAIKAASSEWEKKYNADTTALEKQIEDLKQEHALDMFMGKYKFSSKAAKAGIRQEVLGQKFTFKDGEFVGAKAYVDGLMNDEEYKAAFVTETPAETADKSKPQFSSPKPQTPPPPKKLSLVEMMMRKNQNPDAEIKYD